MRLDISIHPLFTKLSAKFEFVWRDWSRLPIPMGIVIKRTAFILSISLRPIRAIYDYKRNYCYL